LGWKGAITFLASLVVVIALWEVAANEEWLTKKIVLPPPSEVWDRLYFVGKNFFGGVRYWEHAWTTLKEVILGFLLASGLGVVLAALAVEFTTVRRVVQPYTIALNAAPKIAFAPLFVVWFGFDLTPKVVMAAFIAFFPVYVNTMSGLAAVEREQVELMASLRASRWQVFQMVKLRQALPYIFAGLKTAMVLAVIGAVVGEFSGAQQGLGYLIEVSASQLRTAETFAFIVILSLLGYLLFRLIELIERRVVFWMASAHEELGQGRGG
jgi:NitT/TauT family transport system permease protein